MAQAVQGSRIVPPQWREEHGVPAARKAGIAVAEAPRVGFLDADDVRWRMAERVRWREAHPDVVLGFSD